MKLLKNLFVENMVFITLACVLVFTFVVAWFLSNLTALQIATLLGFGILLINTVIFLVSYVLFAFSEIDTKNKKDG